MIDTKALRQKILDMAIKGELVPQDRDDEPASVLMERIRAEKQKLIKEGKIKKDKNDSIIFKGDDNRHYEKVGNNEPVYIEDELPFDIPDSWCWARFSQIAMFELGKTPERHINKYWNDGIIQWFSIADMKDRQVITVSKEKISKAALHEKFSDTLVPKGTLIMSFKLTVGRTSILGIDAVHNEAIISIYTYMSQNNIISNYLLNALGLLVEYVEQTNAIKGVTLNSSKIKNMLIPIPPLAEQERIVARVKELFVQIDIIEQCQKDITFLYDEFRKRTLTLAIQGKLVPQDENDEPASVLLEKIRSEKKAKLGKKYVESYIYKGDDNCYYEKVGNKEPVLLEDLPFEIPKSWEWVRLGTLFQHNTGKALNSSDTKGTKRKYITTSNLYWGYFILDNLREMHFTDEEIEKCSVHKGDLLVCEGGDIGRAAVWDYDYSICIQNHIHKLHPHYKINIIYFYYVFYVYKSSGLIGGKGIGIQGISSNAIDKIFLPLPPIEEQNRICECIKKAFTSIKDEN